MILYLASSQTPGNAVSRRRSRSGEPSSSVDLPIAAAGLMPVLFEDPHYIFVQKPAGLPVVASQKGGSPDLLAGLAALGIVGTAHRFEPCYMLDPWASGVVVVAKTPQAVARFDGVLRARTCRRQFAAVVTGRVKAAAVGRAAGEANPPPRGKPKAGDLIRVIRRKPGERRSIVEFEYLGRSQRRLRIALAGLHFRVLGDREVAQSEKRNPRGRMFLHLQSVELVHPITGEMLRVVSKPPASFDVAMRGGDLTSDLLATAMARRFPFLSDRETNAFRVFDGRGDGMTGLQVDRLANVLVMHTLDGKFEGGLARARRIAAWFVNSLGGEAAYWKRIPKDRSDAGDRTPKQACLSEPIVGSASSEEITVRESGIDYIVRPNDGFHTGLFLDQRGNRRLIQSCSNGKRVLNTFAYTCSFSVAAAMGGAALTISVDISKKYLDWGRRNFAANRVSLDNHLFFCSDTLDYLKRAKRQGRKFDIIILDPPTFARTRRPKRVFQVAKDMHGLMAAAIDLLDADGVLFAATNDKKLSAGWLREQVALASCGRAFKSIRLPEPADFCPGGERSKTVAVRFS